jgi:ribosomal protein S18 acetylase RimI-like enzyme
MHVDIVEEGTERLADYGRVPIAFRVDATFGDDALDTLARGGHAVPTPVPVPYEKDYDAIPDGRPTAWPTRFDVGRWIILGAFRGGERVGGAVVVVGDPAVDLLGGQPDAALLWDLRVAPAMRHRGVGTALLAAAENAAAQRGARVLRVETQQINVAACRFYEGNGFSIEQIRRGAYPDLPDEVQLLWSKTLG